MGHAIRITVGGVTLAAELNDSPTARDILTKLPIEAAGNRWGEEIYFAISVKRAAEPDARAEMEVGELAYWPPGNAFCIFFGPTPASTGDNRPMMASPGNPVGRLIDDAGPLRSIPDGATVRIEKV